MTKPTMQNGSGEKGAWAAGLSQEDLMEKDTVLVLDVKDKLVGSASKKDSHVFSKEQPRGVLHRAFSVFLFDKSDKTMLLQQRASSKITFPNVWTNTCCSHPLHGMTPGEVDDLEAVANGNPVGVKHAAIRKLKHELGIPLDTFQPSDFKFLTRLHYWAADTVTHGPLAPWGEHEIDYCLFVTVDSKDKLVIDPHPEEIDNTKWVSMEKLDSMLADKSLLFSPWFRLIVQKWLKTWWKDLDKTMTTDIHCDFVTIYQFDPPQEHMGGAGNASALFLKGDDSKKQGAYGKIKTHKESLLSQIVRTDEAFAALSLLYINPLKSNLDTDFVRKTFDAEDLAFCDDILVKVSRSFAGVIRQLPSSMLVDIMIFYLVLRALDTIEDDTTSFESSEIKINYLKKFHETALEDPKWSMDGVGAGDERRLLQNFPKCHRVYKALQPKSREVIADITRKMAYGMAEFVDKDLGQGTLDLSEYSRYCHFVAGLVGEGLSRLFAASGLEPDSLSQEMFLADQMGLFLQKTNIIRDYLEDYVDKRAFWPQSVWKKYSKTGDLGYFTQQSDPAIRKQSLYCLNELITNALELVPDCLDYLAKLRCQEIFRFCAIPQVMAIATLDKCYSNSDVFTGVVKIRKGLSCKLILKTNTLAEVHDTFRRFAMSIMAKAKKQKRNGVDDPSFDKTIKACETIVTRTTALCELQQMATTGNRAVFLGILSAALAALLFVHNTDSVDANWQVAAKGGLALLAFVSTRWKPLPSPPSRLRPASDISKNI
ncbi:hypothetical protein ACA910_022360 [Epithemia clementina (nom. ined.)]